MTKTINEYQTSIKDNLTTAENLCADLRKLRGLKKLAESITDVKNLVAVDVLDKTVTDKEAELKKVRVELQKARRVVKKMVEIEAIETGAEKPKATKSATSKPAAKKEAPAAKEAPAPKKETAEKPQGKKAEQPADKQAEGTTAA